MTYSVVVDGGWVCIHNQESKTCFMARMENLPSVSLEKTPDYPVPRFLAYEGRATWHRREDGWHCEGRDILWVTDDPDGQLFKQWHEAVAHG